MDTEEREFTTPKGATVRLHCRTGTNDQMMAYSALNEDEYGLGSIDAGTLSLVADIGAHIGMVAIGIALDHPGCDVIAVEPLAENVELMRRNAELNGVANRMLIIHGAASKTSAPVTIAWDFEGHEAAEMHRYVGNQPMPEGTVQRTAQVPGVTLASIIPAGTLDLLVTDCEGGEYELLGGKTPAAKAARARVTEIRGEFHGGFAKLADLLAATHEVCQTRGDDATGGFVARVKP